MKLIYCFKKAEIVVMAQNIQFSNTLILSSESASRLNSFFSGDTMDLKSIVPEPEWFAEIQDVVEIDAVLYFYLSDYHRKNLDQNIVSQYFECNEHFYHEFSPLMYVSKGMRLLSKHTREDLYRKGSLIAKLINDYGVPTISAWRMKYWGCEDHAFSISRDNNEIVFMSHNSPAIPAITKLASQFKLTMSCEFECKALPTRHDLTFHDGALITQ